MVIPNPAAAVPEPGAQNGKAGETGGQAVDHNLGRPPEQLPKTAEVLEVATLIPGDTPSAQGAKRKDEHMELRYLGFDQSQNARAYRFDLVVKGDATKHFIVTVDLTLFRAHRVGIQEGPSLCAQKLATDLENCAEGVHELTMEDLRAYADARAAADARKIEARKGGARRPRVAVPDSQSPWHSSRR